MKEYELIQRMKFELKILEERQTHSGFRDLHFHLDSLQQMINQYKTYAILEWLHD